MNLIQILKCILTLHIDESIVTGIYRTKSGLFYKTSKTQCKHCGRVESYHFEYVNEEEYNQFHNSEVEPE